MAGCIKNTLFSIENTIVDYVAYVDDRFIAEHSLRKGDFAGISAEEAQKMAAELPKFERHAGGSAANVLHGFRNLGGQAVFCGSVGNDENARYYRDELEKSGIEALLAEKQGSNGVCYVLITPDGERTFALSKGSSISLCVADIPLERLHGCLMLHTTAYALDHPEETVEAAMEEAKKYNMGVSFDLASVHSVKKHRERIWNILNYYCSVVFANEAEAYELTGLGDVAAALRLASCCGIGVVKFGKKGSVVAYGGETYHVYAFDAKVKNTNGAGDGFAAGFLYALALGKPPVEAGFAGSYYASKVVETEGTRLHYRPNIEEII